jgi:hypothetical protein
MTRKSKKKTKLAFALDHSDAERQAVDAAWLEEVQRRDAAFRKGAATARPVQDVINRLLDG